KDKDITKVPAHKIVSMGMAHVPEGRRVFAEMTVLQNLKMGAYTRTDKDEIADSLAEVYKRFPRLEERQNQVAGTLSGGEQQMLAMGRALMSKPEIILMDEPAAGMNPNETAELMETIHFVRDHFDMTILLIEHDMKLVSGICEELTVLNFGSVLRQGETSAVLNDPEVIKAYLGDE
ncbi:MAG: ATP-binding cassette domain-containing protein, partial [Lachnospiraceae bacterium]|nr:ATP-binding cassette domain-containing protein [Lachnospiraceae bacterium]